MEYLWSLCMINIHNYNPVNESADGDDDGGGCENKLLRGGKLGVDGLGIIFRNCFVGDNDPDGFIGGALFDEVVEPVSLKSSSLSPQTSSNIFLNAS